MNIRLLLLPLMAIALQACKTENAVKNSENYVERNINVNEFTNISIEGSNNVYFIQGNKTSVKVSGNEEDIKRMKIYSKDNTLHIKEESKSISLMSLLRNPRKDVNVYVTSPNIRGVSVLGSGNFSAKDGIDTDRLKLKITGSGDISINSIICNESSIGVVGSGSIEINSLTTAQSDMGIPGSGSISISNATIKNVTGSITGSGSIELNNANIGYAKSKITGSGSIDIQGKVDKHDESVTGSGSVNVR